MAIDADRAPAKLQRTTAVGRLHVEEWGTGDRVVLVHGSLATGVEEWEAQRWLRSGGPRAASSCAWACSARARSWASSASSTSSCRSRMRVSYARRAAASITSPVDASRAHPRPRDRGSGARGPVRPISTWSPSVGFVLQCSSMSTPVSVRFPEDVAGRLRRRSTRTGEPASGLVVRLVDEGMRMEEHPGVVFRYARAGRRGRAGQRPGRVGGDRRAEGLRRSRTSRPPSRRRRGGSGSAKRKSASAEGYYGAYPTEIDDRIAENVAAADEAQRASAARARLYG